MILRRHPLALRSCNLIPLRTIRLMLRLLRDGSGRFRPDRRALINLAGNVAAFIPMGFLLPAVWPRLRRFGRTVAVSACAIAALEALQYATVRGAADVDDLLLNLVGAALGYAIFAAGRNAVKQS